MQTDSGKIPFYWAAASHPSMDIMNYGVRPHYRRECCIYLPCPQWVQGLNCAADAPIDRSMVDCDNAKTYIVNCLPTGTYLPWPL
ncbi:uncharacterized protein BDW47DRAFT_104982 [Aspergillus candidus]|uniref:Uncharacterized protein n=1 Tax=Aspergillus candidus TaxID=41067 RepID=A0A2I2FD27_ASPCN|nr:hypothetical protein BDW47DRAFT_104982 [Aspergillus candidus]PLB38520.1 hypothetical protein BDW47DRAFT_104982 [Aspergillus candidus]